MGRALAVVLAGLALAAGAAAAGTIELGRGIGPWKLGGRFAERPGLVRSEHYAKNVGPGCVTGPESATRIDYYRALRVAWRRTTHGHLSLIDVATTRAGDRTADGLVVGASRLADVRRRHPHAVFRYAKGPLALGTRSLTMSRPTGKETFAALVYWFDARGVLSGLESLAGGC